MSIYSLFETDKAAEVEGHALTLHDVDENGEAYEIHILIARAGGSNSKYGKRFQSLMRPHQHAVNTGTMKDEVAEKIVAQVMAETLILDWDGIKGRDGEDLECTIENKLQLLNDLPQLREVIWAEANKVANFMAVGREEAAKN